VIYIETTVFCHGEPRGPPTQTPFPPCGEWMAFPPEPTTGTPASMAHTIIIVFLGSDGDLSFPGRRSSFQRGYFDPPARRSQHQGITLTSSSRHECSLPAMNLASCKPPASTPAPTPTPTPFSVLLHTYSQTFSRASYTIQVLCSMDFTPCSQPIYHYPITRT
jgi:hypothetical protein